MEQAKLPCLMSLQVFTIPLRGRSPLFKGKDVTKATPNRMAGMGMVRTFQIPRPFKELTVYDNVAVATLFNPRMESRNLAPTSL